MLRFRPLEIMPHRVAKKYTDYGSVQFSKEEKSSIQTTYQDDHTSLWTTISLLVKASVVGVLTGFCVMIFKTLVGNVLSFFYGNLNFPKPTVSWTIMFYPLLGSMVVALIIIIRSPESTSHGIDYIAKSIAKSQSSEILNGNQDGNPENFDTFFPMNMRTESKTIDEYHDFDKLPNSQARSIQNNSDGFNLVPSIDSGSLENNANTFTVFDLVSRACAAVATLGSGCSLGPEGPSVEIGAGISRLLCGQSSSLRERHHLFLAGVASGVAAGFDAPIAGIFFAIECGNRYLTKNGVTLKFKSSDDDSDDGPRVDLAAIVLASTIAAIVIGFGKKEAMLTIEGDVYTMESPIFEFPLYLLLGLLCGLISILFLWMKNFFTDLFQGKNKFIESINANALNKLFGHTPAHLKPLLGGLMCGFVAIFYPQTIFFGYVVLDELLRGSYKFGLALTLALLLLKIFLTSFSISSGLVGGTFAPTLFFGAAAGTAYHRILKMIIRKFLIYLKSSKQTMIASVAVKYLVIADAPAYATVGAAATLGALYHAPLTASMLMFELTQNHGIVLPVLASTGLGGLFAEVLWRYKKH